MKAYLTKTYEGKSIKINKNALTQRQEMLINKITEQLPQKPQSIREFISTMKDANSHKIWNKRLNQPKQKAGTYNNLNCLSPNKFDQNNTKNSKNFNDFSNQNKNYNGIYPETPNAFKNRVNKENNLEFSPIGPNQYNYYPVNYNTNNQNYNTNNNNYNYNSYNNNNNYNNNFNNDYNNYYYSNNCNNNNYNNYNYNYDFKNDPQKNEMDGYILPSSNSFVENTQNNNNAGGEPYLPSPDQQIQQVQENLKIVRNRSSYCPSYNPLTPKGRHINLIVEDPKKNKKMSFLLKEKNAQVETPDGTYFYNLKRNKSSQNFRVNNPNPNPNPVINGLNGVNYFSLSKYLNEKNNNNFASHFEERYPISVKRKNIFKNNKNINNSIDKYNNNENNNNDSKYNNFFKSSKNKPRNSNKFKIKNYSCFDEINNNLCIDCYITNKNLGGKVDLNKRLLNNDVNIKIKYSEYLPQILLIQGCYRTFIIRKYTLNDLRAYRKIEKLIDALKKLQMQAISIMEIREMLFYILKEIAKKSKQREARLKRRNNKSHRNFNAKGGIKNVVQSAEQDNYKELYELTKRKLDNFEKEKNNKFNNLSLSIGEHSLFISDNNDAKDNNNSNTNNINNLKYNTNDNKNNTNKNKNNNDNLNTNNNDSKNSNNNSKNNTYNVKNNNRNLKDNNNLKNSNNDLDNNNNLKKSDIDSKNSNIDSKNSNNNSKNNTYNIRNNYRNLKNNNNDVDNNTDSNNNNSSQSKTYDNRKTKDNVTNNNADKTESKQENKNIGIRERYRNNHKQNVNNNNENKDNEKADNKTAEAKVNNETDTNNQDAKSNRFRGKYRFNNNNSNNNATNNDTNTNNTTTNEKNDTKSLSKSQINAENNNEEKTESKPEVKERKYRPNKRYGHW